MRILKRAYWIVLLFIVSSSVEQRLFAEQQQQELTAEEQQALDARKQTAEIRKILSSEPDPSLMLEPIPDPPEDKRKKIPTKPERPIPPGERAVAAQASGQPLSLGGSLNSGPNGGGGVAAGGMGGGIPGSPVSANALNPVSSALNPGGPVSGRPSLKMGRLHGEAPPSPEIAVILHNKQFFPSRIRLKAGIPTKVYFTTTAERPAAIVVEQLQVQKWLAKDGAPERKIASEYDRAKFEVTREVVANKMTEITFEPRRGTYGFHDAISGAKGQIVVE